MDMNVKLQDGFFAPRQKTGAAVTIPSSIARCEETGRLRAFKLDWKKGMPDEPHVFWDSDVAKVMEGMAEMVSLTGDKNMAGRLDELVDLVVSAQQPDGYLNTHFTVVEPEKRWTMLHRDHELYCAGHLMEAAVAHFRATGSRKFLDAMCRYADYIDSVFGPEPEKKKGYPGHEELELALIKLYHATGEKRYLQLARYFVLQRGQKPNYFVEEEDCPEYRLRNLQADKTVLEQDKIDGHAVRALYFASGVVDVARETGDQALLDAAKRLFDNLVNCRMYLVGGAGSTCVGEEFTFDYALPNNTAYAESCAAMALVFFAKRMLDTFGERRYADVMEQSLFNNAMSGLSLSGDQFFYANPMECNHTRNNDGVIQRTRQPWFDCSCCPTSYCRFLPQIGDFCYRADADKLTCDIPVAARCQTARYDVEISGNYPYDGKIVIQAHAGACDIAIRRPAWCDAAACALPLDANGYWQGHFAAGESIEITLDLPVRLMYSNPRIPGNAGRVAVMRGPLVYCLESADNPGIAPYAVLLPRHPIFRLTSAFGLPEGTVAIECPAEEEYSDDPVLYRTTPPDVRGITATFIPYALWQNRQVGDMQLFCRIR